MGLRSWFFADITDPRRRNTSSQANPGYITYLEPHEMLAWSRWQLGWLDATQVRCIGGSHATVTLSPISQPREGSRRRLWGSAGASLFSRAATP